MLQRLGIRGKILAVVAVPILVLLAAAGFVTYDATTQLSRAGNTTQLIDALDDGRAFATVFRTEGDYASNYLSAWTDRNSQMQTALFGVNQARAEIESASPAVAERVEAVLEGGQETPEGPALGVDAAREVRPDTSGDGLPTWPEADEVELVGASYVAMSDALEQIDAGGVEDVFLELELLLEEEGERTVVYLSESAALQEQFDDATIATDEAWQALQSEFDNIADTPVNADVLSAVAAIESAVARLDGVRETVRERSGAALPTFSFYFSIAQNVVDLTDEVSLLVESSVITRELNAYSATDQLLHEVQKESNQVDRLIRAEEFRGDSLVTIREQFARTDFSREQAASALDALEEGSVELPSAGAVSALRANTGYSAIRSGISTGFYDLPTAGQVGWEEQVAREINNIEPFTEETLQLVDQSADLAAEQTLLQSILTVVGAILVVIASLFVALLIARRIVGPLRRLTTTATAVRQELPRLVERVALPGETVDVSEVQIPVESSDEVGRLAEAFNSVNAATLAIAGEQAALRGSISEMFVNVARRDQVLLNRQLASIDEMERTSQDATTLTRLFALDHLATRMRRNSESLLVLAGIDTGRRLRRPMPLSDVIRTASSEIELYERVELELDADPAMVGHSALTVAHLFAELLENATVFSDPGTPVVVRTAERGGNYVVEVVDGGIGMTPDELKEANARVASTAASEILGAQRLGLFVVGRIARRVGAQVDLSSTENEGTTAVVTMPPSLFDPSAEVDAARTSDPASDAAADAPSALVSHDVDDEYIDFSPRGEAHMRDTQSTPASVGTYEPSAVEEGASLTGRASGDSSIEDLIASDAASSPAGPAVDPGTLTSGTTQSGLPSRRRRDIGDDTDAPSEKQNVMGLPAEATEDQMSALDAESTRFTPSVASNEVAPQSAEERAAMFRGFRPRREGDEGAPELEPDAESLGQATRRGAVPPGSLPGFGDSASATVPQLEPEDDDQGDGLRPADARHDDEPVVGQSILIATGYVHEQSASAPDAPSGEVPSLEEDEVPTPAPSAQSAPIDHPPSAGVERVSLNDRAESTQVDSPPAETPATELPQEHAGLAPEQPAAQPQAATEDAEEERTPSLDDIIGGGQDASEDDKAGFFGRLFGRGGKTESPTQAPSSSPAERDSASTDTTHFAPSTQSPAPTPATGSFQPQEDDAADHGVASALAGAWPQERSPSDPQERSPSEPQERSPSDPQEYGTSDGTASMTPAESAIPYNPGAPGTPAPHYSPDQLARPQGWETAGASALEASRPEAQTSYKPVVDIQPAPLEDEGGPDVSEVFSELSSLSAQRPNVEKTRAGLAKRRADDAPPVEVEPIEQQPPAAPANRNPEELRDRFSSFYSGTQRARRDVAELDGQAHTASAKD
ncbi:MAG: ATP-binding protein [Demequina sp.]